ncbi:Ecdysteroid kinase-like family [Popillia japonica]|uniref:Ecdysteroid kinase-like family n=1 Tax=Popillia japonica TaxID=7064 RepID=A0AAW1LBR4_POPJA
MFLYENDNKENPTDVMLVDWQLLRPTSPVFDLSYFYLTIATEESLNKLDYYLDVYYGELSRHLKELGSDPEVLYPKSVFEKEWKQHCKYGFAMAFILLKFMLVNKADVPKFEEFDIEEINKSDTMPFFTNFDKDDEYVKRLRTIAECMIARNYI